MFFVQSKILGFFVTPSNFMIGLGLVGILLLPTRYTRIGRQLLVASILLIAAIGILPLGDVLTIPLEDRFPRWTPTSGPPSGIVVLGGAINAEISSRRGGVGLSDAAERLTAAADLARRYPAARVVFTGGNGALLGDGPREADFAICFLESLGVAKGRIIIERRARNTIENAAFTKQLVAPAPGERWLLMTSAMHMPRAIGVFREAPSKRHLSPAPNATTRKRTSELEYANPERTVISYGPFSSCIEPWCKRFVCATISCIFAN